MLAAQALTVGVGSSDSVVYIHIHQSQGHRTHPLHAKVITVCYRSHSVVLQACVYNVVRAVSPTCTQCQLAPADG